MHLPPLEVAPDTFLLRSALPAYGAPLSIYMNSLLIRGPEPVVVDTGLATDRDRWLAELSALVDPIDVAWVFLSHDDEDHSGNLAEVLELCPNATLVTSWAAVARMAGSICVPSNRMRWVGHGQSFDAGDRTLHALRPPVYDSPCTRGLFDSRTGVFWAADAFATPMPPEPVTHVAELDALAWGEGVAMFAHHGLAPWLSVADPSAYRASVRQMEALAPQVIVSAHAPVISGPHMVAALRHLRSLPEVVPPPAPDQSVLAGVAY